MFDLIVLASWHDFWLSVVDFIEVILIAIGMLLAILVGMVVVARVETALVTRGRREPDPDPQPSRDGEVIISSSDPSSSQSEARC